MSDNYEFEKSKIPQGVEYELSYAAKKWSYIPDINSGIYASNGPSLINFDLTSIFNSQMMVDPSQMFVAIPIVLCTALSGNPAGNAGAAVLAPPVPGYSWAYAGLKAGYYNLIHQADLTIHGQTIEMTQPFLNVYTHIKLLSQMSQDDLKSLGSTIGLGDILDNPQSLKFVNSTSPAAPAAPIAYNAVINATPGLTNIVTGNGFTNNLPFPLANNAADYGDMPNAASEYYTTYNNGYYSRLKKVVDTNQVGATTAQVNLFGGTAGTNSNATTVMTSNQLANEFKPYCVTLNTNYTVVYDVAIIRLCDIFDSMKN